MEYREAVGQDFQARLRVVFHQYHQLWAHYHLPQYHRTALRARDRPAALPAVEEAGAAGAGIRFTNLFTQQGCYLLASFLLFLRR
ncbi:MAG: hypothetical protein UX36_C0002G0025 [Microgenomates group bacterium GW2011_GWC1_46_15]|nr:MAG: hypothetical protein UX36_C0002G0025 [Microgenomates group bacterium GW2011_GWC1_46_15]